jgi:hypothetical protein
VFPVRILSCGSVERYPGLAISAGHAGSKRHQSFSSHSPLRHDLLLAPFLHGPQAAQAQTLEDSRIEIIRPRGGSCCATMTLSLLDLIGY